MPWSARSAPTTLKVRPLADGLAGAPPCGASLAIAWLEHGHNYWAISGDSDGIDGTEDAAGALIGPDTPERARRAGLDSHARLAAHDSYTFFASIGDLVRTGPTLTNVNDIRAVLIAADTGGT